MRTYTLIFAFLISLSSMAQEQLPVVYLNENISTHFVSKLNIDYLDMSTPNVAGNHPHSNFVSLKPKRPSDNLGVATIVGESFFLQFRLKYTPDVDIAHTRIDLDQPEGFTYAGLTDKDVKPLEPINNYKNPNYSLSHEELARYAAILEKEGPSLNNVVSKKYKMSIKLNNVWVVEDYIYLDYTTTNKANIPYTIDEIRYKIVDAKQLKATNSQDRFLEPDYVTNPGEFTDKKFRNIAAFKKFTFPNDKAFIIEIAEDQISGRKVTLEMTYSDILSAANINGTISKNSK